MSQLHSAVDGSTTYFYERTMELGTFSVSLAVKDLAASRSFYEKLGFEQLGGDGETYLIMRNATTVIGLFQGMFEKNILTFNPGWSGPHEEAKDFTDVREIERTLKEEGVQVQMSNTSENPAGPAHLVFSDPDGNQIMLDQHR